MSDDINLPPPPEVVELRAMVARLDRDLEALRDRNDDLHDELDGAVERERGVFHDYQQAAAEVSRLREALRGLTAALDFLGGPFGRETEDARRRARALAGTPGDAPAAPGDGEEGGR